jgi:hypothetical protein
MKKTTIDITPTHEETVRIYAYVLASHGDLSPYDFGEYWSYTEEQSDRIIRAYIAWDLLVRAYEQAGLGIQDMTPTQRRKFIKSALNL